MAAHAVLSASGSHRWMNCTPSARLEQKFPDNAGVSAEEGTFAHSLAELELRGFYSMISDKEYQTKLREAKKSRFYSFELHEYVDEYTSMIIEKVTEAETKGPVSLLLEQRLDFGQWVPGGFGRGDAVIISENKIEVCDLKYGRSVPVSAVDNSQLRLYALGAYEAHNWLYDIQTVQVTICQPRNGGVSTEVMTVEELLVWGEQVKPIARMAIDGQGETQAGDWCRFCKAAPRCKKLAEYTLEAQKNMFKDPDLLSDTEVTEVLKKIDSIKAYASKVQEYALNEAKQGHVWPGFKLVEGRSNRKYTDEAAIAKVLIGAGYEEDAIYQPRSLQGITAMKKIVGKKFDELLSDYIVKPEGKPTLVPESDKRPALNQADRYFNDLDEKGE